MLGFKAFHSADATLSGTETAHMIRKGELDANSLTAFWQFAGLAAYLRPHNGQIQSSKKFATEPNLSALISTNTTRPTVADGSRSWTKAHC